MASFIDNLFKSKTQREQEIKDYKSWAYPYGDIQKEKIDALIHEFVHDEDPKFAVYNYLVCRQKLAPSDTSEPYNVKQEQLIPCAKALKKEYNSKGRKTMHKYMALVEADLKINEDLNYPSIEELNIRADYIKSIIGK